MEGSRKTKMADQSSPHPCVCVCVCVCVFSVSLRYPEMKSTTWHNSLVNEMPDWHGKRFEDIILRTLETNGYNSSDSNLYLQVSEPLSGAEPAALLHIFLSFLFFSERPGGAP